MSFFDDVGGFHRKFGLPVTGFEPCRLMNPTDTAYRVNFLLEEVTELRKALIQSDLPAALDALADIVYVALGTAHYMHAPFNQVWEEVQRSNMEKVLRQSFDDDHKRGASEVIRKPPGWLPPQIGAIVEIYNMQYKPEGLL